MGTSDSGECRNERVSVEFENEAQAKAVLNAAELGADASYEPAKAREGIAVIQAGLDKAEA